MNNTEQNQKAVERLRTSKQQALKELHEDGVKAGAQFALHIAEYLNLERLERWRNDAGTNVFRVVPQITFTALAGIMADRDDTDEEDTVDWAREGWGDDVNQPAWVEGFVEGALAKYHDLREELGGQ